MKHENFHYKTLDELKAKMDQLSVELPLSENLELLKTPVTINGKVINNRIVIQPMEGCDGTRTGEPDELTYRRYDRFAKSGAGLIWLEAVAAAKEGRANPRQLFLEESNLDVYKAWIAQIKETCLQENGFEPVVIMQCTHSGRYSKPNGVPEPIIAYNNPLFEKDNPIPKERIITDERLQQLEVQFGHSAKLAQQAGFDGVDIKCCHRYLNSELLSAYTRQGAYGGSFENRTRLLRNGIASAKAACSSAFIVTSRLNLYDGFPYPFGFGVNERDGLTPDMTEPIRLVGILQEQLGVQLLDCSIGNPYVNPHVNRPYDKGGYLPEEHPLEGVSRMYRCIGEVQKAHPQMCIISSGLSYLRQYSPYLAAGAIEQGYTTLAGFGREAFAYPQFPNELFQKGKLDPNQCCITCGKCTELMRHGSTAGCVIRDRECYAPIYQQAVMNEKR